MPPGRHARIPEVSRCRAVKVRCARTTLKRRKIPAPPSTGKATEPRQTFACVCAPVRYTACPKNKKYVCQTVRKTAAITRRQMGFRRPEVVTTITGSNRWSSKSVAPLRLARPRTTAKLRGLSVGALKAVRHKNRYRKT